MHSRVMTGSCGELLATLRADVASLQARHPLWRKADFGREPVRMQLGCPGAAMPSARLESNAFAVSLRGRGAKGTLTRSTRPPSGPPRR